jgi:hypothetical protein
MLPTRFWFIWPSGFREEDFLKINQSETGNTKKHFIGFPQIEEFYEFLYFKTRIRRFLAHLAKGNVSFCHLLASVVRFQSSVSTNQKQELPVAAMFVNGSGQNVQSLETTIYRCFLPSFSSFGRFQRRRLKCEKLTDDRRRTPSDGKPLKQLGQMNRNLVGSIYGRSSVKIAHFVPIR